MLWTILVAGLLAGLASDAGAAERIWLHAVPIEPALTNETYPMAPEPAPTVLAVGDPIPQFSFLTPEGTWKPFRHLAASGGMLLIFGAHPPELQAIERYRSAFAELGLTPVSIMDRRAASAASYARRVGWSGATIGDGQGVIADLFNSLDPSTRRHAPSYVVVDSKGTIRQLRHGPLPELSTLIESCARGLGRPLPPSAPQLTRLGATD